MQLTENDTTQDMPAELPADFFVPDEEFDAAIDELDGLGRGIQGPTPAAARPRPGMLFDEVDTVLRRAGVAAPTMESVRQAMRRELEGISREIAERVTQG